MKMGLCMCVTFLVEKIVLFSSHFNYYSTLIYCLVTIALLLFACHLLLYNYNNIIIFYLCHYKII